MIRARCNGCKYEDVAGGFLGDLKECIKQHENVLELCGFTSIANVRPPNTATTASEKNKRWIIWVDKRRGLLGRTAVTCPTRVDPPPGRRHTQFLTRQTAVTPDSETTFHGKDVKVTRSLSILTGLAAHVKAASAPSPALVGSGENGPKDDEHLTVKNSGSNEEEQTDESVGCDQSKRLHHVRLERDSSRLAVESAAYDNDVGIFAPPSNPPLDNACGKVQVLLDGLNRPSRVAAVTGSKSEGVFFIDEAPAEENDGPRRAALSPKDDAHRRVSCSSGRPTRRVGRVRFLPWGSREAITLVERLCNPIALSVHGDSSVFVLEELWGTQNNHDAGRDREPDGKRQTRYRVCCMRGPALSTWLKNEAKHGVLCRDRAHGFQGDGECQNALGEGDQDSIADGTTEAVWKAASRSTCDFSKNDQCKESRSRGVVDFVEVLALPVLPESYGRAEQPVDLCVLTDRTIVVAFYRSAPLHSGVAVSENRGAVRVFPITRQGCRSDGPTSIEAENNSGRSAATASRSVSDTRSAILDSSYSSDDSWLVAEGLPVVTGVAAGGGRGIYFSLCGAGRDGAVTAIGSLSTARAPPSLPRAKGIVANDRGKIQAGNYKTDALASRQKAVQGGKRAGGKSGDCGAKFVRVVSGFAAALTVDEDMNLFYLSAENKRSCHALWCSVPGACSRRVSFLRGVSPNLLDAGAQLSGVPKGGVAVLRDADIARSAEDYPKKEDEGGRNARRGKASLEAVAATDVVAADQAAALSAALTEEDQAVRTGGGGRKPLFTSCHALGVQGKEGSGIEGAEGGGGGGGEPANIVVVSRCRPLLLREIKRGVRAAVFCNGDEIVVSDRALPNNRSRRFGFDRVFGPKTSQARVYAEGVSPVVRKMLDGYNCSVLAYGQTGSGKTFTMEGGLSGYPSPARGTAGNKSREKNASSFNRTVADDDDDELATVCTDDIGIIPRAVHTIFREGGGGGSRRYWVYVSHMEIYNERLFDLLASEAAVANPRSPPPSPKRRSPGAGGAKSPRLTGLPLPRSSPRPLSSRRRNSPRADGERENGGDDEPGRIETPTSSFSPRRVDHGARWPAGGSSPRLSPLSAGVRSSRRGVVGDRPWNAGGGVGRGLTIEENRELGVIVKGLTQVEVKNPEDIFAIIARSKRNRRTAETMCNVESSRSHGIFCVRVISAEPTPWGGEITRDGRLSLVDLSGSENIKRSGAVGARAKEAAAIGQSLLALGRVIKALVNGAPHIPYRESKLTRVLGDSLGGNAFTAIILNITPNHGMLDETLNTLVYAKTAQSVRNAPKQRITNKSPSEVAKTGDSASDAQTLGGKIVKEMERRKGSTTSQPSPGSSRVHIRPWESKVPIRALPSEPVPEPSHTYDKSRDTDIGGCGRGNASPFRSRESNGNTSSHIVERKTGMRPATAGATRSMAGTQVLSHEQQRFDERGYWDMGRTVLPVAIGECEPRSERRVLTAPDVAQGNISSMSEKLLPGRSSTSRGRHSNGGSPASGMALRRVFNSTAAVWVHSVVLEPSHRAGNTNAGLTEPKPFPARRNSSPTEQMKLTAVAQRAIEEVFDRFDIESRGFLPSSGIASVQEVWTRPEAEPPPPRHPTESSLLRPRRGPGQSETRRGSATILAGVGCETDERDMRALTRESFVEFCRRAAARDAIFIRHMFARCGYDYRLELPLGAAEAVTSADVSTRPPAGRTFKPTALGERKPGKDIVLRQTDPKVMIGKARAPGKYHIPQSSSRGLRQKGANRVGRAETSNGGAAKPLNSEGGCLEQTHHVAPPQDGREHFEHENDDDRGLATGGIVDATELWDWTEDRRDHEERHEQGGLLSRGGGAHISRVAPRSITGRSANLARETDQGSTTEALTGGTTTRYDGDARTASESPRDLDATDACADTTACSLIPQPTVVAHDLDVVFEGENVPVGCQGGSNAGGIRCDASPAQEDGVLAASAMLGDTRAGLSEERVVALGVPPCLWCGAVIDAKEGVAVHTAEFCDEDSVVASDAR